MNDADRSSLGRAASWRKARDSLLAAWELLRMPGRSHRGPLPPADDALRAVAEELRRVVTLLAGEIGERNVQRRPKALERAAEAIEAELAAATGARVEREELEARGVPCANLVAELPGRARPGEIVVLGAHYDTVPGSPGANDNASGVAALLALARALRQAERDRALRLVAFVNEEAPFGHTEAMGSLVHARASRRRGDEITAMLSLETIGCYLDEPRSQRYPRPFGWIYPSRGNFVAFVGSTRHARLVREVARAFRAAEPFPSQAAAVPEAFRDVARSDHWSFWKLGYPALMVTDTADFRYDAYHTAGDTPERLDYERLARVVRGLGAVTGTLLDAGR